MTGEWPPCVHVPYCIYIVHVTDCVLRDDDDDDDDEWCCVLAASLCAGCDAERRRSTQLCAVRANRRVSACREQTFGEGTAPALGATFRQKSPQTLRTSRSPGEILQSSVLVYAVASS